MGYRNPNEIKEVEIINVPPGRYFWWTEMTAHLRHAIKNILMVSITAFSERKAFEEETEGWKGWRLNYGDHGETVTVSFT